MTAPRAFYLTLPNGNPKLLSVRTLGELEDIALAHYQHPLYPNVLECALKEIWEGTWSSPILREVQA